MDTNLNNISASLKKRFCKDCNIPINIFQEPYFFDRILLYDKHYGTKMKWARFVAELKKYKNEQSYYEEYNRVKDEAINSIKSSEAYRQFNDEDMSNFYVTYKDISSRDIYHPGNDGKMFLSIDMTKANFSALQHYGKTVERSMFAGASTWENFMSLFTDNEHIISSKYIRQVILGNCNPRRHITYEKYLMDGVLAKLEKECISLENVVFFSNDEIIIDLSGLNIDELNILEDNVINCMQKFPIPLKAEIFILRKIKGVEGYVKIIFCSGKNVSQYKFKCVEAEMLPFVIRTMNDEDVKENDKVFFHNGLLCKYEEVPEITFSNKTIKFNEKIVDIMR